jgi:hypothetical protein
MGTELAGAVAQVVKRMLPPYPIESMGAQSFGLGWGEREMHRWLCNIVSVIRVINCTLKYV